MWKKVWKEVSREKGSVGQRNERKEKGKEKEQRWNYKGTLNRR